MMGGVGVGGGDPPRPHLMKREGKLINIGVIRKRIWKARGMLGVGTETPDSFLLLSQHPVPGLVFAPLGRRQLPACLHGLLQNSQPPLASVRSSEPIWAFNRRQLMRFYKCKPKSFIELPAAEDALCLWEPLMCVLATGRELVDRTLSTSLVER